MVFSSVEFLFLFLPVVIALYFIVPSRLRNLVLLASSLLFYIWGGGALVLILLVSTVVDYLAGWIVSSGVTTDNRRRRRLGVTLSIAVNVGLLSYFKYANFIVEQFNSVGDRLGLGEIAWTSVVLPIGISFFTFQSMSYTIDVSRGRVEHLRNPFDFALYVALFPQLIAGPIVRFHEIAGEIRSRVVSWEGVGSGAVRFAHGLAKKVIFADAAGAIADQAFAMDPGSLTTASAWLGIMAYTIQIYFDFSGYSDMAIGLGRVFGFNFPENFNRPYSALSITDFWRRWHITLSNWFRDYVYIPLGGSQATAGRTYFNLWFVFLVTGIWHGANWTFVAWGLYHGALLTVERLTGQRPVVSARFEPLRRFGTLFMVVIGWVLFRAESVSQALSYLAAMFTPAAADAVSLVEAIPNRSLFLTLVACGVFFIPRDAVFGLFVTRPGWRPAASRLATLGLALPYALVLVISGSFSPFLYFQF